MDQVAKKTNHDALKIFKKAIENVKPLLEVKTRRVGGANYQVPVEVNNFRRQSLAIRWILQYSRERSGKTMTDKLCDELIDAANARGGAIKKKEDVHRMAEANNAFAHYRWQFILLFKGAEKKKCPGHSNSKTRVTSGSWRTLTPERRRQLSASCFIRVSLTRSVPWTKVPPRWTGWSRSANAASPLRLRRPLLPGCATT